MCVMYQRYVCADILFIQVILLLSSPGETPLTYQAASAYLSFAFNFLVITPTLAILHYYTNLIIESIRPH